MPDKLMERLLPNTIWYDRPDLRIVIIRRIASIPAVNPAGEA